MLQVWPKLGEANSLSPMDNIVRPGLFSHFEELALPDTKQLGRSQCLLCPNRDPKADFAGGLSRVDAIEKVFLHCRTQISRAIGAAILQLWGGTHQSEELAGDLLV